MTISALEKATFAAGPFRDVAPVFGKLPGVLEVTTGYMEEAEVVHLTFDPAVLSYAALLDMFWKSHDPTQLDRQGSAIGSQYRSAIFYHTAEQRAQAIRSRAELDMHGPYPVLIVTEVTPASNLIPATTSRCD